MSTLEHVQQTIVGVLVMMKRFVLQLHNNDGPGMERSPTAAVVVAAATAASNSAKVGKLNECIKEICTFEESPFYIHRACAQGLLDAVASLIAENPTRLTLKDKTGWTCLHHAVSRNKLHVIDLLLSKGCDINARLPDGSNSLHIAVEKGKADTVFHLLVQKIDGNVVNEKKMAPIHTAAFLGSKNVVEQLCKFPDQVDVNLSGFRGQIALHFAAIGDHDEVAEILLKANCKLDLPSDNAFYPIHVAAKCGSVRTLKLFLNIGYQYGYPPEVLLRQIDKEKNNALHMAVNSGNSESVLVCLNNGAAVDSRQEDFSTPLHLACAQGSLNIVELLYDAHFRQHGDEVTRLVLEMKDVLEMTPLHRAAMFDHPDIVQYLLNQRADIESTDQERRTPLLVAAACGGFRSFRVLLKNDASVSAVDVKRRNILHFLVARSYNTSFAPEEFVSLCQSPEGKRLLDQKDGYGRTPLHYAAKEGSVRCIETFIPLGAQINLKDGDDRCPLHFAAKYGRLNAVRQLLQSPAAVNVLNETDGQGMTALHIASMKGHTSVVQLLLYKGALLHRDYLGRTPLHLATENNYTKTARLLLEFHHNLLDQRDRKGNTALHYAVINNCANSVDFLLTAGCVYSVNDDHKTPMDIALENQFFESSLAMVQHKRWDEILSYNNASAFMGLIKHLPQICTVVLNRCITRSGDPHSYDYWERYDFRFLEIVKTFDPQEPLKKIERQPLKALNAMVAHQRVDLLSHPVSLQYLATKWRAYGFWAFCFNLIFYAAFVASLTGSVISLGADDIRNMLETMKNNDVNSTVYFFSYDILYTFDDLSHTYVFLHTVAFSFVIINVFKEFAQIYQQRLLYFSDSINYLEWSLYIASLINCYTTLFCGTITNLAWQSGAVAVFLAWFNLLLYLQRLNSVGLYVVMFIQILRTMLRVILVFSVLIVAFGFTFFALLANSNDSGFMSPIISVVRSVMLMMGDWTFVETFVRPLTDHTLRFPFLVFAFLLVFVVLVPILFVNLLTGLAVGDIEMVQKDAQLKRLAMQVEYHTEVEKQLPQWLLRYVLRPEAVLFPRMASLSAYLCRPPTVAIEENANDQLNNGDVDEHSLVQDPVLEELARTKCRLKEMQERMGIMHDLMCLMVNKLGVDSNEIETIENSSRLSQLRHDDEDDKAARASRWRRTNRRISFATAMVPKKA